MPHPHAGAIKASSRGKFKSITGASGRGQVYPTESQDRRHMSGQFAHMGKTTQSNVKIEGSKGGHRLDRFARGGKVKGKHGGNHVNVAVVVPGRSSPSSVPVPGPAGAAGPPVAPAPRSMPPQMSATGSPMPPPGIPMRKNGGKVTKKAAGGVVHGHSFPHMKYGANSGMGAKEKAHKYGLKPIKAK